MPAPAMPAPSMLILLLAFTCSSEQPVDAAADLPGEHGRCGARSLQCACQAVAAPISDRELDHQLPASLIDASLADLQRVAAKLGLATLAVHCGGSIPSFVFGEAAAILHVEHPIYGRHFLTVLESHGDYLYVVDYPHDPGWVFLKPMRDAEYFHGDLLLVAQDGSVVLDRVRAAIWKSRCQSLCYVGAMICTCAAGSVQALRSVRQRS